MTITELAARADTHQRPRGRPLARQSLFWPLRNVPSTVDCRPGPPPPRDASGLRTVAPRRDGHEGSRERPAFDVLPGHPARQRARDGYAATAPADERTGRTSRLDAPRGCIPGPRASRRTPREVAG